MLLRERPERVDGRVRPHQRKFAQWIPAAQHGTGGRAVKPAQSPLSNRMMVRIDQSFR